MATKDALRLLLDEAEAEARISSSLASSDPSVEAKPCSRSQSSRMRTTNLNEAAPAVAEDAHLDSVTPEHTKPLPIPVNSADGAETLDTITENKILRSDEPLRWRLWHMHKVWQRGNVALGNTDLERMDARPRLAVSGPIDGNSLSLFSHDQRC